MLRRSLESARRQRHRPRPRGGVDLISRPGNNFCSRFPDLTESLAERLGGHSAILDGEVIARDGHGRPNFARLQRRLRVQRPSRTLLSSVPASFCVYLDSSARG